MHLFLIRSGDDMERKRISLELKLHVGMNSRSDLFLF